MSETSASADSVARATHRLLAALLVATVVALLVVLLHGGDTFRFLGHLGVPRRPLVLLLGGLLLLTLVRALITQHSFGRAIGDRVFVLALLAACLGLLGSDVLRILVTETRGDAISLLIGTATLFFEGLVAALATSGLLERNGMRAGIPRFAARIFFSLFLCSGVLLVLESLASPRTRDWYSVEALDGSTTLLHEPDPDLYWRMRPHFRGRLVHPELGGVIIETNSDGFRDREFDPDPCSRPGGCAVLLGDSIAMGLGVPEPDMLSRQLEKLNVAPRVVNTATAGFGTLDELVMLDRTSKRVRPSLVVTLAYLGNDLEDNLAFMRRHLAEGRREFLSSLFAGAEDLAERARDPGIVPQWNLAFESPSRLRKSLERRSSLCRAIYEGLDRMAASRGMTPKGPPLNGMLVRSLAREPDAEVELAYRVAVEGLRAIQARASALGAKHLVCLAPTRIQVDSLLYVESMRKAGLDLDRFDLDRPQAVLKLRCAEAGIDLLDLAPDFRERTRQGECLFFAEGHWRGGGDAVAARAIAEHLRRGLPATRAGSRSDTTSEPR